MFFQPKVLLLIFFQVRLLGFFFINELVITMD